MTDTITASASSIAEAAPTYQWYADGRWRDAYESGTTPSDAFREEVPPDGTFTPRRGGRP